MSSDLIQDSIIVKGLSKYFPTFSSPLKRLQSVLFGSIAKNKIEYNEKDFCALKNVSFTIPKGDVVAILGSNGSGKSTLLQVICKTLSPSKGHLEVNGRVAALLELGAGFNPEFTGRENIFLNATILGLSKNEIQKKIDDIIEFSEISTHIDQPVKHYSSGMFVRLAFSIAINVSPEILIIDEALSVGDARFQAKCIKKIQSIIDSGTTILFVSHDITAVRTLCKRAIWLDNGEVVLDGEVFDVSSKFMQYMYDDSEEQHEKTNNKKNIIDSSFPENKYISHWGSCKGLIKNFRLTDNDLKPVTVFDINQWIQINIDFNIPDHVLESDVNIAISIKNIKGIDLVVLTSQVEKKDLAREYYKVSFSINNQFSPGEYLIVVALENSLSSDVFYYEYIEGVEFFISESQNKIQGLFAPNAVINFS